MYNLQIVQLFCFEEVTVDTCFSFFDGATCFRVLEWVGHPLRHFVACPAIDGGSAGADGRTISHLKVLNLVFVELVCPDISAFEKGSDQVAFWLGQLVVEGSIVCGVFAEKRRPVGSNDRMPLKPPWKDNGWVLVVRGRRGRGRRRGRKRRVACKKFGEGFVSQCGELCVSKRIINAFAGGGRRGGSGGGSAFGFVFWVGCALGFVSSSICGEGGIIIILERGKVAFPHAGDGMVGVSNFFDVIGSRGDGHSFQCVDELEGFGGLFVETAKVKRFADIIEGTVDKCDDHCCLNANGRTNWNGMKLEFANVFHFFAKQLYNNL